MQDRFARELSAPRLHLALMAIFAVTALVLAVIGVFGVVSQRVRGRRRELAIRLTLGAEGSALARGVVADGMILGGAGLLLGLAGALAASGIMERFLFGVSARDPLSFSAIALLLLGATALAAWLPARHTVRLNPSESLRGD